jgi:hypothetical protein
MSNDGVARTPRQFRRFNGTAQARPPGIEIEPVDERHSPVVDEVHRLFPQSALPLDAPPTPSIRMSNFLATSHAGPVRYHT